MAAVSERVVSVFWLLAGRSVRRCLMQIDGRQSALATLSDEALLHDCRELVDAPKPPRPGAARRGLRGKPLGERDAEALALGAEAFSRFPPAGLEAGTRLRPQQLLTAVHLLRGTVVQMDSGEGKTFAIATAAFALLRPHARVYIVTANPYLAARDAASAEPFWKRLGISCGLALPRTTRLPTSARGRRRSSTRR